MASTTFFIPAVNMMGAGSLNEAMQAIHNLGFRKVLIVTDAGLASVGVPDQVARLLAEKDIGSVIFDGTKPNPTVANVEAGLAMLHANQCDCVISLGGGSPHDCAMLAPLFHMNLCFSVVTLRHQTCHYSRHVWQRAAPMDQNAAAKILSISACDAGRGLVRPQTSFSAFSAKTGMSLCFAPSSLSPAGMPTSLDN